MEGLKKDHFTELSWLTQDVLEMESLFDQVGTYNPMLPKDNPDRVKIDVDKAKEWMAKGAQPSDRVNFIFK